MIPRRVGGDSGLTLLEMLIAVMLTGIIMTVLVAGFLVFFTNASYTTGRDDHSAAAEILATYLDRDLASATSVPTVSTATSCAAPQTILRLRWKQYNAAVLPNDPPVAGSGSDVYTVAYQFVADNQTIGKCMLQRVYSNGAGTITTNAIVHDLASAGFSSAQTGTCGRPSETSVIATLAQYRSDSPVSYSYTGCLKSRTDAL